VLTTVVVLSLATLGWAVAFYLGMGVGARAMAEHLGRKDRPLVEMVTRIVVHRCAAMSHDELQTISEKLRP
jgi:hypothetical protein